MAKKKLSLWGIRIEPSSKITEVDSRITQFKFLFKVDKGSPADSLFYSSPKLRSLIEKYSNLEGQYTGMNTYFGRKNGKTYELSEDITTFDSLSGAEFLDFIGKGIALELERKVLGELEKRLGKIRIAKKNPGKTRIRPSFGYASKGRRYQVSARGIRVDADQSYETTLQQMRSGIRAVRKKFRKKFRIRKNF